MSQVGDALGDFHGSSSASPQTRLQPTHIPLSSHIMYASSSTDLYHNYETTSTRPEGTQRSKLKGLIRRLGRRPEHMKDSESYSQRSGKGYSTDDLSVSTKEAEMFTNEDMAWSRPSSRTSRRSHRRHHHRANYASSNQGLAEMLDDENSAWV
ncbi:hypothetical protein C8Q80DRAFT_1265326 [Daedaleopsis nitida]|nr:hypothetical protein C8Q80DRAFT_1265326 [Daedaleopsis nitida]